MFGNRGKLVQLAAIFLVACTGGSAPSGEAATCLDTMSSAANCGACGVACGSGEFCTQGQCTDSCPLTACGQDCADTQASDAHCGGCNQPCSGGSHCKAGRCTCLDTQTLCGGTCTDTQDDPASCGDCELRCASGQTCRDGACVLANPSEGSTGLGGGNAAAGGDGSMSGTGNPSGNQDVGGSASGGDSSAQPANQVTPADGGTGGVTGGATVDNSNSNGGDTGMPSGEPGVCEPGNSDTTWATDCPTQPVTCSGNWQAPAEGSNGHPLQHESEHFAIYYYTSSPGHDGLEGSAPLSQQEIDATFQKLEAIWDAYFGSPIFFPEPYCDGGTRWKATLHLDDSYPLWGGSWDCGGAACMGLWVSRPTIDDDWGLAHEFMHGVQGTTPGFPECGGSGCWIFESHANWMPHQIYRSNTHCSDMLVNMPHLHYGNTRDRYCNWQFFEYLKDKYCYSAVNEMWVAEAQAGMGDPFQKLMANQSWDIEQLNDLFGEWAMHNVTWDYKNPPPAAGDQGEVYRQNYGSIEDTNGARERRLRLTRLEPLDEQWTSNRRFQSPYYWAPQRWGYNVVRLYPETDADAVTVTFRGVTQAEADSGWRYGLVATDEALASARYSSLHSGSSGEVSLCISPGERVYLVVVASPTTYQKIVWGNQGDGTPYPSIYRYPYLVEVEGAWPAGFQNGELESCPAGTERHSNGGGCAPSGTEDNVYVGPHARVLGGSVSGSARIEDHATILNGASITGGTVGAMSIVGNFSVSDDAVVQSVFYPMDWFGQGLSASGSVRLLGDLEMYTSKNANTFFGLVDENWSGVSDVTEVTVPPPYTWSP